ncbi:MAG TPA: hypothetical protein VNF47_10040 [Streptosporangiaceae bacterium]|nr:hypothetical protein [Streptosporangiaceae bacterium]
MTTLPAAQQPGPAAPPGRRPPRSSGNQRYGHIISREPAPGEAAGEAGKYQVRDDDTGQMYSFGRDDIVTEGFRSVRAGEHVRFLADPALHGQARYVVRLDLPDIAEYYT